MYGSVLNLLLTRTALLDAFKKLNPRVQMRNPVMFVVYIGSLLTTALYVQALLGYGEATPGFILAIALWLWFTVLFANFAEALEPLAARTAKPVNALGIR